MKRKNILCTILLITILMLSACNEEQPYSGEVDYRYDDQTFFWFNNYRLTATDEGYYY